jgi:hypothetical protein
MKSIPTGMKLLCLLLAFLPASLLYPQTAPYLQVPNSIGSSNINIYLPPGVVVYSWQDLPAGSESPRYSLWLEKGDGNYCCNFSSGPVTIPSSACFGAPVMMASALYEHRRRPPTTASSVMIGTPAAVPGKMSSPALTSGQVKLFTSTRDIVDSDYVVAAISYVPKLFPQENIYDYKLVFRYNNNEKNTFIPILNPAQMSGIKDFNTQRMVQVNDVRKFNNENVNLAAAADLNAYRYGLTFDNIKPSDDTANIFISLLAAEKDVLPAFSNMEAELFYRHDKGGQWISRGTSAVSNMQSVYAHDPNSISVSPRCLSLPKTLQTLHYTINFQNTGKGAADRVMVAFHIPQDMNQAKKIWNLKASYSDIPDYVINNIVYDWDNSRIIFTLDPTTDLLDGTEGLPYPVSNPKTMGQLSFDLQVMPGSYPNSPDVLEASADIYFHGATAQSPSSITAGLVSDGIVIAGTEGFEMPVRTNNALVVYSACCDGNAPHDCSKGVVAWLLCYWWVILLILLILLLWWLYRRRRRA